MTVDIIIPSFKNIDYLKLTIESVEKNTSDFNLIIVDSSADLEITDYLNQLQLEKRAQPVLLREPTVFAKALNAGLALSENDVVFLNNDVIVGPGWLEHLKNGPFDIANPFSNCDTWIHQRDIEIEGIKLKPYMSLDEVPVKSLMSMESPHSDAMPAEWVAFYATYIRRKVIEEVGLLDPSFQNGGEDIDFCRRAIKQGFTCGFVYQSWVFHFGGRTRLIDEDGNYLQDYRPEDKFNHEYNQHKAKPTVVIHTGPAWESWNWKTIHTTGIGGSETCAAYLAKHLADNGYRAVIIGDCLREGEDKEGTFEGVEYLHHDKFDFFKRINYIDHFISSRRFFPLTHPIKNGQNYVWAHDIWVDDLPQTVPEDITFIVLSPWHQTFFCQHHQLNPSQTVIIGNGLDLSRYEHPSKKDPYRLVYSSCPSRGLVTLLQMFPHWKSEFPELNLHIYYGFDNWKKIIEQRGSDGQLQHLRAIESLMDQDGVHFHGRVSQTELAQEQMKASLWVYPTEFKETYCITANEAMLAGAVPVCTNFMTPQGPSTLEYTVPDGCGIKVSSPGECFQAAKELLSDPSQQQEYRERGSQHVRENCGWENITQKWISLFTGEKKKERTVSNPNIITKTEKPFKLAIGLPMLHPFIHYKFVNSYLGIQRPEGTVTVSNVGSLTALARNQIVDIVQQHGAFTHLLFMDTDMTFPADTIRKLVLHDKDVVSGLYFERYAPYRPMVRKRLGDGYSLADFTQAPLIEVDALGTGCMLIKMDVFDKLEKPYFEYRLTKSGVKETFLSEDIVFCERVRKAGIQIFCDTTIRCGHLISDYEITEANWDGSTEFRVQNWG